MSNVHDPKWQPMKKYILPVIITLLTLLVVMRTIPFSRIPAIPKQISATGVLLGLVFYLWSYVLIAARWKVLFTGHLGQGLGVSRFLYLPITGAHQLYANFLPARTGDLTILYLAKKHLGVESPLGLTSLIVARALDFLALGILALIFLAWQHHNIALLHSGYLIFAVCLTGVPVVGIFASFLWGKRIAAWLDHHVAPDIHRSKQTLPVKLAMFFARALHILSERKSGGFYFKCLGISLLLMLVRIGLFSSFALYSRDAVPPVAAILIGLSTLIASVIPVQGVFGMGAFEGGWVLGYVLAGYSTQQGLLTAVSAHLLIIVFLTGLGSLSHIILYFFLANPDSLSKQNT